MTRDTDSVVNFPDQSMANVYTRLTTTAHLVFMGQQPTGYHRLFRKQLLANSVHITVLT